MNKGFKIAIYITLLCIILILGISTYVYKNILEIDTIYKGITVDGIDISNMNFEQALEHVKSIKSKEINNKAMKLYFNDLFYNIKLSDMSFSYRYDKAIDKAFSLGREGSILNRLKTIDKLKDGENIALEYFFDDNKVVYHVNNIAMEINRPVKDGTINIVNKKITVTDDVIGRSVYTNELIALISGNMVELKDIEIPVKLIEPTVTKASLSRIDGIIGEFSTSFKGSSAGRIENIRLSTSSLNNMLVLPGKEVSYNDTTGPRSAAAGYKEANVIFEGEFTSGLGGGVCQTSTTLYNALLLADLEITERYPHSIPINYVPYGQDAAVSYNYLDLKFKNKFDFPIYIQTKISNNRLYVYIFGDTKTKNYTVKITPEIVEKIAANKEEIYDDKLEPGTKLDIQTGRTGYKVKTYKSVVKDGKVVSTVQISFDHYRKRDHIYKVGPNKQNNIVVEDPSIER